MASRTEGSRITQSVENKVSRLEAEVTHLTESHTGFKREVLDALREIKQGQKGPNLVAFSGWASVILVIIISIGGLSLAPMRTAIDRIIDKQEDARTRLMQNGWSKQDQIRFEKNFDDILQREMRLLDDVLQREMHLNDKIIETKVDGLSRRFDTLERSYREHDKDVAGLNQKQDAYIESLKESLAYLRSSMKTHRQDGHGLR